MDEVRDTRILVSEIRDSQEGEGDRDRDLK